MFIDEIVQEYFQTTIENIFAYLIVLLKFLFQGNIITHFNNSKNEAYYSPHNTTWFKGFLVTATATIGLGAIFAMAK